MDQVKYVSQWNIILLYLSGLNMMAPILNNKEEAMVGAKTKKPNKRMWED